jgi:DNA-nicking Smr family endonuclease
VTGRKPPGLPEPKRQRVRRVTPEEASLWDQVTSSVAPHAKAKPRVPEQTGGDAPSGNEDSAARPIRGGLGGRAAPPAGPERVSEPLPRPASLAPAPKSHAPPAAAFDRRKMRHLASGKLEIDARLDLHGLRQSEARYRLVHFIRSAHDRGCRMVLVITGKGSREPIDRLADALGEPQRGILRRVVPQWLDEPDMRAFVIGFTTAGPRHGGEGALYVRLRRPDRGWEEE